MGEVVARATTPRLRAVEGIARFPIGKPDDSPFTIVVNPPDPKSPLAVGSVFTQTISVENSGITEMTGPLSAWQMDIVFNPAILKLMDVTEGSLLERDGINALFSSIDLAASNANGRIRASQARIGRKPNTPSPPNNTLTNPSPEGISLNREDKGELVTLEFEVLAFAEEPLGIHNVQLSSSKVRGEVKRLSYSIEIRDVFVATDQFPPADVNRDGSVNVQDLMIVARSLGAVPMDPRADVNEDGFVNVLDLVAIYLDTNWSKSVSPTRVRSANAPLANGNVGPETIQEWIDLAQVEDDGSAIFDIGVANLEALLAAKKPATTRLLLNYPNPFNPETWIPYQLAEATEVTVTIHAMNGALIRTLELGHQAAGVYQSKSQAAYWDGRNAFGEQVASGVYFYTLTAGSFSATGKMLVRK